MHKLIVKTKTWIEDLDKEVIFSKGKRELLEYINKSGSILKASKLMGITYKKAWLHLQDLQNATNEELVTTKKGRSKTSGTQLTTKAIELLKKYTILEQDIQKYADQRFKELFEY